MQNKQHGFGLIEFVVVIVVMGIALTAMFNAWNYYIATQTQKVALTARLDKLEWVANGLATGHLCGPTGVKRRENCRQISEFNVFASNEEIDITLGKSLNSLPPLRFATIKIKAFEQPVLKILLEAEDE